MEQTTVSSNRERVLVLLLTYGEPRQANFREQYDYSLLILKRLTRRIARIPKALLPIIALMRARTRVKTWRAERYASPLEEIHQRQTGALEALLRARSPSLDVSVRGVFEFRRPLLPEVLAALSPPPDRLVICPLYLADSDFTSGISLLDLEEYAKRAGAPYTPAPEYVSRFSEDERLVELMAVFVQEQLQRAGVSEEARRAAALVLGAHGTLVQGPLGIETGYGATQCFYQRLAQRLAPCFARVEIGWLNHRLGGEWTQPELAVTAAALAENGLHDVVYFPFGFFADNAESELEGRCILREHSALRVIHLPCLNDWPPFLEYLASRVLEQLGVSSAEKPSDCIA